MHCAIWDIDIGVWRVHFFLHFFLCVVSHSHSVHRWVIAWWSGLTAVVTRLLFRRRKRIEKPAEPYYWWHVCTARKSTQLVAMSYNHTNTVRTDTDAVYRTINATKRNVVYFRRIICVQKRCPHPFYPYRVSPSRFVFSENISENWSVSTENVLHAVVSPTRGDFDRHDSLWRRDVAATFFVMSAISRA